jgi:phenylpropionate dioxygenase-like ring-hydroxylating dioxygenase large terminal subunit
MKLDIILKSQTVQNFVREVGINANYWYAVGWADPLKPGEVMPVNIWQQEIVVYRDANGHIHALENVCPHKGVALHKGKVQGCQLACGYHGWEFNGSGECVSIPYMSKEQKLPRARIRSYPVQEKYNLIWIFPGDPKLADSCELPEILEFDQPDLLMVSVTGHVQAHFSICHENLMDAFHGFLHQDLQPWLEPTLISLQETETAVTAEYQTSFKGRVTQFLGLSERSDQATTLFTCTQYRYPHYYSSVRGIASIYLMLLPVGPTESRSFTFFFFKIRLPQWILKPLTPLLRILLQRFVLLKLLAQDIEMLESEQRNYLANPQRPYVEINPAVIATQRVMVRQYEQFMQKSSEGQSADQSCLKLACTAK